MESILKVVGDAEKTSNFVPALDVQKVHQDEEVKNLVFHSLRASD